MRKISANYILPVSSPPLQNGIITLDHQGRILEINDTGGKLREESGLEFYPGSILPDFVLPWLRFADLNSLIQTEGSSLQQNHPVPHEFFESGFEKLDRELTRNGIYGVGMVLRESMISDGVFKRMQESQIIYHPVIELCPAKEADDFDTFNRGIKLVSHAWNHFKLHCSLTVCPGDKNDPDPVAIDPNNGDLSGGDIRNRDMIRYLSVYSASHQNLRPPPDTETPDGSFLPYSGDPLNVLKRLHSSPGNKSFAERLSEYTLKAAGKIFEEDVLGSIEPGKTPGLILVSGLDPQTIHPRENTSMKILV